MEANPPILISYSQRDKEWLEQLRNHLIPFEREGNVRIWNDAEVRQGVKWLDEIQKALDSARIVILLVSADYIASNFIGRNEFGNLLKAAEKRGCTVLSLIVTPVMLRCTELSEFTSLNPMPNPLSSMSKDRQEKVFARLVNIINNTLNA